MVGTASRRGFLGDAIRQVRSELPENETTLRQHVDNQAKPHMQYSPEEEKHFEEMADKLQMSVAVLKAAQNVANELEDLQETFVKDHYMGIVPPDKEHKFIRHSWGQFAVFDTLMHKITNEVEQEAEERRGKAPVSVQMKRDIRDEIASKEWQQVLNTNRLRTKMHHSKLDAMAARRSNAALIIQQSWHHYKRNKLAGKLLSLALREKTRKSIQAHAKQKIEEEVRMQRKLAMRHAVTSKKLAKSRWASLKRRAITLKELHFSPPVSLAPSRTQSRVPSFEQEEPVTHLVDIIQVEEHQNEAEWLDPKKAKKKVKRRWLNAKTTSRLEKLSQPVMRNQNIYRDDPENEVQRWKRTQLAARQAQIEEQERLEQDAARKRSLKISQKIRPVVRIAEGSRHASQELGEAAGEAKGAEAKQDMAPGERVLRAAKTFQEFDEAIGNWMEANAENINSIDGSSHPPPQFRANMSEEELKEALENLQADCDFIVNVSALHRVLKKKLQAAKDAVFASQGGQQAAGGDSQGLTRRRPNLFSGQDMGSANSLRSLAAIMNDLDNSPAEQSKLWYQLSQSANPMELLMGEVDAAAMVKMALEKIKSLEHKVGDDLQEELANMFEGGERQQLLAKLAHAGKPPGQEGAQHGKTLTQSHEDEGHLQPGLGACSHTVTAQDGSDVSALRSEAAYAQRHADGGNQDALQGPAASGVGVGAGQQGVAGPESLWTSPAGTMVPGMGPEFGGAAGDVSQLDGLPELPQLDVVGAAGHEEQMRRLRDGEDTAGSGQRRSLGALSDSLRNLNGAVGLGDSVLAGSPLGGGANKGQSGGDCPADTMDSSRRQQRLPSDRRALPSLMKGSPGAGQPRGQAESATDLPAVIRTSACRLSPGGSLGQLGAGTATGQGPGAAMDSTAAVSKAWASMPAEPGQHATRLWDGGAGHQATSRMYDIDPSSMDGPWGQHHRMPGGRARGPAGNDLSSEQDRYCGAYPTAANGQLRAWPQTEQTGLHWSEQGVGMEAGSPLSDSTGAAVRGSTASMVNSRTGSLETAGARPGYSRRPGGLQTAGLPFGWGPAEAAQHGRTGQPLPVAGYYTEDGGWVLPNGLDPSSCESPLHALPSSQRLQVDISYSRDGCNGPVTNIWNPSSGATAVSHSKQRQRSTFFATRARRNASQGANLRCLPNTPVSSTADQEPSTPLVAQSLPSLGRPWSVYQQDPLLAPVQYPPAPSMLYAKHSHMQDSRALGDTEAFPPAPSASWHGPRAAHFNRRYASCDAVMSGGEGSSLGFPEILSTSWSGSTLGPGRDASSTRMAPTGNTSPEPLRRSPRPFPSGFFSLDDTEGNSEGRLTTPFRYRPRAEMKRSCTGLPTPCTPNLPQLAELDKTLTVQKKLAPPPTLPGMAAC